VIPTPKTIGRLYTNKRRLIEADLDIFLFERLTSLGWTVYRQKTVHGFKGMANWRAPSKCIRTADLHAWCSGEHLLIESKWPAQADAAQLPERGLGQILLAARLFELQNGFPAHPVLAAPYWSWHRQLPEVCERAGVIPWPIDVISGYEPPA
jgi:hypothetical protein